MMQDPVIMGQLGQNPMAQQMQGAIMAHVAEHLAFQYRQKVQEQLGATLPEPDAQLDPQIEVQVSKLVAQAAVQLLAMDKAKAAQQQALAQAQDPIIQMQQAELQIKKQDADTKQLKVKGDLQIKSEELSLTAQESAAKVGEDPAMAAMRLQQEIAQAQELHGMEMAAKRMELQQAQAQQQQAMAQQQQKMAHGGQVHAQKMAHGGQVHGQNLQHKNMTHMQKMRQSAMDAEKANKELKKPKKDE
jgi:hypothetical protein